MMNALTALGALVLVKPMRLARSRANQAEMPRRWSPGRNAREQEGS